MPKTRAYHLDDSPNGM